MELRLITFEQAKALRELGFPQKIVNFNYLCTSGFSIDGKETSMISSVNKLEYIAPPLELVAKWLRNEKDIHISCEFEPLCDSYGNVIGYEYNVKIVKLMLDNQETETTWLDHYKTYEDALSAGIDKAIEILSNKQKENILNEYVDLELPSGTLWAKCNIGAKSETEYGDYFMWGNTTPDTDNICDWGHAPFNNGQSLFDKTYFNANKSEWLDDNVLKPEYDAAHVIMGSEWRMPTNADFNELLEGTTSEWVNDYNDSGVNGRLFTSKKNGNTLFFPAAGDRCGSFFYCRGDIGYVWSSTLGTINFNYVWELYFNSSDYNIYCGGRYFGFPVRGVMKIFEKDRINFEFFK